MWSIGLLFYVFAELPLDKVLFKKWQEDNKQFVETKASREVEGLIKCKNIVIVTGHTGSGKSAIVHHVALKYRSQGWSVKPICAVMDMKEIINVSTGDFNDRTIFVLSDPIGKDSFDEIEYNLWRRYEEFIKACLKNVKLLMSCKKYIFSDGRIKGLLKDKSHVVDLSNETFKLSIEEKENIWITHDVDKTVSKKELKQILKTETYFPLLCKLYFSKKIYKNRKRKYDTSENQTKTKTNTVHWFFLYCSTMIFALKIYEILRHQKKHTISR